jgi:5-(carboxyamino)imidazole ribonucleotide synthase
MAHAIAGALGHVGMLAVEFFLTREGGLLVNELAPRPHNSGHLTLEAAQTSQFEQQVRTLCGLPLGTTELTLPGAMANLLGDLWSRGSPAWERALGSDPGVHLHLYGKPSARPGRKMGHLTVLDEDPETALRRVTAARDALVSQRR